MTTQSLILAALLLPTIAWASDAPAPQAQVAAAPAVQGGLGALARDISCNLNHPKDGHAITQAVEIIDVASTGAAYKKGLRSGDLLLSINGSPVSKCAEIAALIAAIPQDGNIVLEMLRAGEIIMIESQRSNYTPQASVTESDQALKKAAELFDKNQSAKPVGLSETHRSQIATNARAIKSELAAAPDGTDARAIIHNMQNIRNIFRDSNPSSDGWMKGNAAEATIQFKKGGYVLVLKGMNNLLRLEVYNQSGQLIFASQIDTVEQRRAVPAEILRVLQSM